MTWAAAAVLAAAYGGLVARATGRRRPRPPQPPPAHPHVRVVRLYDWAARGE